MIIMDNKPFFTIILYWSTELEDHLRFIIIKVDQKGEYFKYYNIYYFLPSKHLFIYLHNISLEKYNTFKINYIIFYKDSIFIILLFYFIKHQIMKKYTISYNTLKCK